MPQRSDKLLSFSGTMGQLAHGQLVQVDKDCSVREASRIFTEVQADFLVVTDNGVPIGIVDKTQLIRYGMVKDKPMDIPISNLMSNQVISIQEERPVFDGLMFMLKHGIKHLLVMAGDQPVGIVSEDDWMNVQNDYPTALLKQIQNCSTIDKVAKLRVQANQIIWDNFTTRGSAISLTEIVTIINDAITARVLQLVLDGMKTTGHGPPPVRFVWIGMGSEGRKAQTIATDQDNGIIFEDVPNEKLDEVRDWFGLFAQKAVRGLKLCGFPLCEGNIMATNPKLCASLSDWKKLFSDIIENPDSEELLEASIYFDFRAILGDPKLANELWDFLFQKIDERKSFLKYFAENILQASRPPIRKFLWKRYPILKKAPKPLDIKREASAPLDAAVRLLALSHGIRETNTMERLRLCLEQGHISKSLADATKRAFDFVMRLRFRLEFSLEDGVHKDEKIVDVKELLPLQVKNLREALETIYQLQDYTFKNVTGMRVPWNMR